MQEMVTCQRCGERAATIYSLGEIRAVLCVECVNEYDDEVRDMECWKALKHAEREVQYFVMLCSAGKNDGGLERYEGLCNAQDDARASVRDFAEEWLSKKQTKRISYLSEELGNALLDFKSTRDDEKKRAAWRVASILSDETLLFEERIALQPICGVCGICEKKAIARCAICRTEACEDHLDKKTFVCDACSRDWYRGPE